MPAALTPRLSILLPGFLVLLIVLTESYGISQEFGWPLHLSGQIEPLVPRLASLIWEMTYIYWVLARVSSLVGEWGSVAFYRHGSLTRWLLHTWASELAHPGHSHGQSSCRRCDTNVAHKSTGNARTT